MISLAQIADATDGQVATADADFMVSGLRPLADATADHLTFYADRRHAAELAATRAGAVMLRDTDADATTFTGRKVVVADAYLAYAHASALFAPPAPPPGTHPSAVIGERCVIAASAVIGAHCVIGDDCAIGADSVIGAGVMLGPRVRLGARCRVSCGAVIGAAGFGYAADGGTWRRIEQLGGVRIGDEVDIGANTTIDRGALGDTVIEDGVKLDNQIQIAHNVQIGAHTAIAGCTAIAGSTVIGKRCQLGGRVSVLDHLKIADDVRVNAGSFVSRSLPTPGAYSSMLPVQPAAKWRRTLAHINRLAKRV